MSPLDPYRPLDPELDWPFFDPSFDVDLDVQLNVRPLAEAGSVALWSKYVSTKPMERHPMLLPKEHWLQPTKLGPNWVAEFNAESRSVRHEHGGVSRFLGECFGLGEHEVVYFIAMRERSYSVPLGAFLHCWPCFLANDDEGAFLLHSGSGAFSRFGPNGSLSFGRRGANAA